MKSLIMTVLGICLFSQNAFADTFDVYVKAVGAKFVGDKTGGAHIIVTDANSNHVLAEGVTVGSTGNTNKLMESSFNNERISEGDAKFSFELNLSKPKLVNIEVKGALKHASSLSQLKVSRWLFPNRHSSNAQSVIVDLAGVIISPINAEFTENNRVKVKSKITMLCGCPLNPQGTWNSADFKIWLDVYSKEKYLESTKLVYIGDSSFAADINLTKHQVQDLTLTINALSLKDANSGSYEIALLDLLNNSNRISTIDK